jgi:CRP-like cAMP-binding protein
MNFQDLLMQKGDRFEKEKGEHVFMQGEPEKYFYYVQSGLLKAYYSSEEGKESIKSFILPTNIISSLSAVYSKKNCSFSLVCLEKSQLIKIPIDAIFQYCKKELDIANDVIDILLKFAMKKEVREFELLSLSAEDRYIQILESQPLIIEKVTQNDLAAYLGITPVGLSRIKKRVITNQ